MKKDFKVYALIWAILLTVWCAFVFLVRPIIPRYVIDYDARFWTAFVFIALALIGNLVCAHLAFTTESLKKMFLNISLITVSWSVLIAMLGVGSVFMLIPNCPVWIVAVVCIIILAFNAITVIKVGWAADAVSKVDERVVAQTSFIKKLIVDIESSLSRAKSDAVKVECKKVYEAVRYSEPMSNAVLSVTEAKITVKMDEFFSAVVADDVEKVEEIADEIVILVAERNKKCKSLK